MITSERCEDIGSWLSENAQKETPEYTSTMAVRLYALTHSFSRRFGRESIAFDTSRSILLSRFSSASRSTIFKSAASTERLLIP